MVPEENHMVNIDQVPYSPDASGNAMHLSLDIQHYKTLK